MVHVETQKFARLMPLSELDLREILPICQRIVVSTETAELRLEKTSSNFASRFLQESPGETFVYREDLLIFRKTSIAPVFYANDSGRIRTREYYREDNDGMYVFVCERLAGVLV